MTCVYASVELVGQAEVQRVRAQSDVVVVDDGADDPRTGHRERFRTEIGVAIFGARQPAVPE